MIIKQIYNINNYVQLDNKLIIKLIIQPILIFVFVLIAVAYFTLAERKIIATVQRRKGPNIVGFAGLLQPLADGLKLFIKETVIPTSANGGIFVFAPIITFTLSLINWSVIPLNSNFDSIPVNFNIGILFIFAISALSVYGIIMAGWSSNSKYAFLGALRSSAQMISYEVSLGIIVLTVVACAGSFNLRDIIFAQSNIWFVIPLFPAFLMFLIISLAETNRHPFDLPEAEAELVAGYNVEYSAMGFALFFLAEYANMILMSVLITVLFFGGWLFLGISSGFFLSIKSLLFVFLFIFIRALLPRYRYDQLMSLGWKRILPISLAFFLLVVISLFFFIKPIY
jgi:NADH-quinone oxidoreductase subunit H